MNFLDKRPRFARRHLHAMLLAEYFAPLQAGRVGAMDAYSNMGRMAAVDCPMKWEGSRKPTWAQPAAGEARDFICFLDGLKAKDDSLWPRCARVSELTPLAEMMNSEEGWNSFLADAKGIFVGA